MHTQLKIDLCFTLMRLNIVKRMTGRNKKKLKDENRCPRKPISCNIISE